MQKERNIGEILIVNSVAATAGMESNNVDGYISSMNTGESVVVSPAGVVVDATGTLPAQFKIGTKLIDGTMQWTDLIDAASIKSIYTKRYAAATLQKDYIGYNGTSGDIDVINSNMYYIRLYIQDNDGYTFNSQKVKWGVYTSDSSATQAEIAYGLTASLIGNLSREPEKLKSGIDIISVNRVNSGTSTATSGGVVTVTKGSKYVSIAGTGADAGKYNADAATIVAGDYIRFGHATTKTYPVYKVARVVSGGGAATMVVELDIAYQGTSGTIAAASVGVIPIVDVGDFGIVLAGTAYSYDPPKFGYMLPRWETTIQDFGSTAVTNDTATDEGNGDWRWVKELEQQFLGNEGNYYRAQVPSPTFRSEVTTNGQYALIVIEHEDVMTGNLGNTEKSLKQTYIACVKGNGGTYSDANTGLGTILNAYLTAYSGIKSNGVTIATEINA